jgi:hypothetical protein
MSLIALFGICGGVLSALIARGALHWGYSITAPLLMTAMWAALMKWESNKLLFITALSDVVYNSTWFFGMMLMGIPTTPTQKLGILLLIIGVYLVG